jgi:protein-S-isoprenylcysteine O-methyltransferase Ste14
MTTGPSLSDEIRSEADRILGSGLLALLLRYGEVHLVGSYTLGLMTSAHMRHSRSWIWSSAWLAVRSLLWTILLPGFFAGYVPWRVFGIGRVRSEWLTPTSVLGLIGIGVGVVLLAACIVEFARSGRGTLSPVDPPRYLVIRGLYKYVRNPMYLSVTTIVLGEVLLAHSTALASYWAIWFVGVNLFVIGYEEPTLRRRFGRSYDDYTEQVGRWIPRFPSSKRRG